MNRPTFRAFVPLALGLLVPALTPQVALAQASTDANQVQGGFYKVESNHTLVRFSVNHFGFNEFFGVIPRASGVMELNPAHLEASKLDITVPVAGLSTTNPVLDAELKGGEWLDSGRFPAIRFVSRRIVRTGERAASIEGDLTLHGVTRPVTLEARFGGAGVNPMDKAYTIGFSGVTSIHRSDFGVTKYVPFVSDEVVINISVAFERSN